MDTNIRGRRAFGMVILAGAFGVGLGSGLSPAYAQKSGTAASIASSPDQEFASIDAQRGAMDRFLDSHPEIASDVVRQPAAMSDPNFLHDHPELQAFLESHPQVKADPRSFISPREWRVEPPRSELDDLMGDLAPLSAFICALLAVLWVLRTLLENRRWNRSFKLHEEVHTKLIEKFASGQDFNAYLQSEGGRRLLEWAPPVTGSTSRGLPNPIGRIFWSVQAGLVLLLMGLGMLMLRGHMHASDAPPLMVFGTLGVTLGGGFILSAVVSYGLSKHLGLLSGLGQGSDVNR